MKFRVLGRTELRVPAVSFGAWAIGGWAWGGSDDTQAIRAVQAGIDAGMTAIDTAPMYGCGRSERVIGQAIAGRRSEVVLMTKAGLRWDDPRGEFFFETLGGEGGRIRVFRNSRPDSLRYEVEQSLARLAVERIDLLQIHWPDPTTPIAESMGALLELRREGKIAHIGASNFSVAELSAAQSALGQVPLASDQPKYSLISRDIEAEIVPWALGHDVGLLVYSPLEQGLLSGRMAPEKTYAEDDQRSWRSLYAPENRRRIAAVIQSEIDPVAKARGATPAQVAIAWTCAQPGITSALVGARTVEQARENAIAGDLELSPSELARIGRAFVGLQLERTADGLIAKARRFFRKTVGRMSR